MQSSSRNGTRVIWLALHTTEGIMRAADLRAWKSWPGSSHASNDETGVLLSGAGDGFVDYDRAAWTLRNGNPRSDNLEQCGWARWTREEWLSRPKLLDTTAKWLADRHKARPWIPLVHLSLDEIRAGKPGVIGHADYTFATGDGTHTDPGKGYPWDVVIAKARAYAGGIEFEGDDSMSAEDVKQINDFTNYRINELAGRVTSQVKAIIEFTDIRVNNLAGHINGRVAEATKTILDALSQIDGVDVDEETLRPIVERAISFTADDLSDDAAEKAIAEITERLQPADPPAA